MSQFERTKSHTEPANIALPFSGRRCESHESLLINKPDSSPRKPMRSKVAKEAETSCPLSPRKPVRSASPFARNSVSNATAQSLPETSFLLSNEQPRKGRRPSRRSSLDLRASERSLRKPARQPSPTPSLRKHHRSASMSDMVNYQHFPRMPVRTSTPRKLRSSDNAVVLSNEGFHAVAGGSSSPSILSSPKKPTRAPSPQRTSCSTMSTSQLSPSEASVEMDEGRERKMGLLSRQADKFSLLL